MQQYEISNFARPVTHGVGLCDSRHNLKYWTRQPYLGFGVDAHSMLPARAQVRAQSAEAVRFATPGSLEGYSQAAGDPQPIAARIRQLLSSRTLVDRAGALEESFFLGLRMNRGVSLAELKKQFGDEAVDSHHSIVTELVEGGLLVEAGERLRLTARGCLLSNEVFARFLREPIHHRETGTVRRMQ
jgi:oxygen-independent coproporphyrinogen-3 oxidase